MTKTRNLSDLGEGFIQAGTGASPIRYTKSTEEALQRIATAPRTTEALTASCLGDL